MLDLRAIAKVDLHRHLEGSLRIESLLEIGKYASTREELAARVEVRAPMRDLMEVLAAFDVFQRAFVSPELTERLAYEAVGAG